MPNVHVAMQIDANVLLQTPEYVLHTMSLKIYEKRQKMLQSYIGRHVRYDVSDNHMYRTGKLLTIDEPYVEVHDIGYKTTRKIKTTQLYLP